MRFCFLRHAPRRTRITVCVYRCVFRHPSVDMDMKRLSTSILSKLHLSSTSKENKVHDEIRSEEEMAAQEIDFYSHRKCCQIVPGQNPS